MSYNVLAGVMPRCPEGVKRGLEIFIQKAVSGVSTIHFVQDEMEYLNELRGGKDRYDITIVVDALGERTMYVPYLQGVQKYNPYLKVLMIVPDAMKGTKHMEALIDMGLFNALYQRDLNSENLYKLIAEPRGITDAAGYYGIDLYARADEHKVGYYGYTKGVKDNSGPVTRTVRDNVSITRGRAEDFIKQNDTSSDDDMLSFFDEEGMGIKRDSINTTKEMKFPVEPSWMDTYKETLTKFYRAEGLANLQAFENGTFSESDFRNSVIRTMRKKKIPMDREKEIMDSFLRDLMSYGKLDVVLNMEGISDIKLNNKDSVTVQYKGEWYKTNITFKTDDEFSYFINKICTKNHTAVNANATQIVFSDIKTNPSARLRITVSHKSVNTSEITTASIRKIDKKKKTANELIKEGYWTKEQAGFLINAVKKEKSIIFSGGSGAGKTVGINTVIDYLADNIPGVCMQEAEELYADGKENLEFQHTIVAKGEGKVEVTLKNLATQGLLKNAKIFIIGEIKGKESEEFYEASNTAQVISSTHTNTAFDVLERLTDLARGVGYSHEQILKTFAKNIDLIVQVDKYKVSTIAGVVGWDEKTKDVIYDVYNFAG